jgi:hypothetical protein
VKFELRRLLYDVYVGADYWGKIDELDYMLLVFRVVFFLLTWRWHVGLGSTVICLWCFILLRWLYYMDARENMRVLHLIDLVISRGISTS